MPRRRLSPLWRCPFDRSVLFYFSCDFDCVSHCDICANGQNGFWVSRIERFKMAMRCFSAFFSRYRWTVSVVDGPVRARGRRGGRECVSKFTSRIGLMHMHNKAAEAASKRIFAFVHVHFLNIQPFLFCFVLFSFRALYRSPFPVSIHSIPSHSFLRSLHASLCAYTLFFSRHSKHSNNQIKEFFAATQSEKRKA